MITKDFLFARQPTGLCNLKDKGKTKATYRRIKYIYNTLF